MKFLKILICALLIFCLQATENKEKDKDSSSKSSSSKTASKVIFSFKGKAPRRFIPGKKPIIKSVVAQSESKKRSPRKTSETKPKKAQKIYVDNKTGKKLIINWLYDGKLFETDDVPKALNIAIEVPEDTEYFNISNDIATVESKDLRVVGNTIYKVSCDSTNSCEKLIVTSVNRSDSQKSQTDEEMSQTRFADIPVSGSINLINNTGDAYHIYWLDKNGKTISKYFLNSNDFTKNIQAIAIKPEKNAIKFKLGSLDSFSDTVTIEPNQTYEISCYPANFACNQIMIKKTNKKDLSKKADTKLSSSYSSSSSNSDDALNIYLVNDSKSELLINWLDIKNNTLTSKKIVNNLTQQKFEIPANAVSFTISNTNKTLPNSPIKFNAEEVYKISCKLIKNICTAITVTDVGPKDTFKITRSFKKEGEKNLTQSSQTKSKSSNVYALPSTQQYAFSSPYEKFSNQSVPNVKTTSAVAASSDHLTTPELESSENYEQALYEE